MGFTVGGAAAGTGSTDVSIVREELRALGYTDEFPGCIGQRLVFTGLDRAQIRLEIKRQLTELREGAGVKTDR